MVAPRILLTTPSYPYPTLPANDSPTDATGQRFTKGDDVFTLVSHTHCYANHILAQNVREPVAVLEYPRWDDFTREIDKGYPIVGISAYPMHLDGVLKMCRYVRERAPSTKILLGSYAGMALRAAYDTGTQQKYVDEIADGEGVHFLRRYLGEPDDRPIRQALMPRAGGTLPYVSRHPKGSIGFLVSGLGCVGGCDFCSTTTLYKQKRLELLSPEELVDHMRLYHDHFPDLSQVFVIEEDHFRQPKYLHAMREAWQARPDVLERLDWFGFGSVDHIGKFAKTYGWEAIAELGLGCVFIGVESKFAGEHGYDKRDEVEAREVFQRLHGMGIRTVGAWICGWDWHHHGNIQEDLNYFVSLCPTYQQLTRLSPFPGTKLWEHLREQGRVSDVPWEDVHFWSGAQKNSVLEPHETLNLTEDGYRLLYRTWGPSLLRRFDVALSGYEFCMKSANPVLRRHRALFFRRQAAMLWTNIYAMDRYAPNGVVRRRVRKTDEHYRALFGEPTPVMEALGRTVEVLATAFKVREMFDPLNRHPKEEPFKRYLYDSAERRASAVPYTVEASRPTLGTRVEMAREEAANQALAAALKATKVATWRRSDPVADDYLIDKISRGWAGMGF